VGPVILQCRNVSFTWDSGHPSDQVLAEMSFSVARGEVVALCGPSGCGKTTLLQLLAGLEQPTNGDVLLDGTAIEGPSPDRSLIFQTPNLFPWLTVGDNVGFGLQFRDITHRERLQRVEKALNDVGLLQWKDRHPHVLSGGMKQRVAFARALVNEPTILLIDEPLTSLDRQTRLQLTEHFLLAEVARRQMTVLYVSHFVEEATLVADRVLLLSARPARVIDEAHLTLPHPRDPETKEFADTASRLMKGLDTEVKKSFEWQPRLPAMAKPHYRRSFWPTDEPR
jgi:NitT/TauT family transport system ATP-binding protein